MHKTVLWIIVQIEMYSELGGLDMLLASRIRYVTI